MKKGLRFRPTNAPVEDIFEAWRDYLKELDDLLSSEPSSTQSSRHSSGYESNDEIKIKTAKEEKICESSENILETACGQPTVRRVPYDVTNERVKADVLKSFSIPVQVCGMPSKDDNRYLPQGIYAIQRQKHILVQLYVQNTSTNILYMYPNFISRWKNQKIGYKEKETNHEVSTGNLFCWLASKFP